MIIYEPEIEEIALELLRDEDNYTILYGPDLTKCSTPVANRRPDRLAVKQSVQARLRVLVKRILRKYKYPPDDPTTGEYTISVNKVLDQATQLADYWSKA